MNEEIAFIQVPKTATVSIQDRCHRDCVQITHLPYQNPTAVQWRKAHPNGFRFAFFRNPFDRLVSAYAYFQMEWTHQMVKDDVEKYALIHKDFREFVLKGVGDGRVLGQTHCRPQVSWITDESGKVIVDFLGHYETLQQDFDQVCRRFGWEEKPLKLMNFTQHPSYREVYDRAMIDTVMSVYRMDFEVGGYTI